MLKKFKELIKITIIIAIICPLLALALSGCGGGGSGSGGGSSSSSSAPAASTETPPSQAPPPSSSAPDLPEKGALITISMPDNSAYAVIAGVSDYPGTENDLKYTGKDGVDFKDALLGSELFRGATVTVKTDTPVTKQMIQNAVDNAKNNIRSDGTFIFFYSGHGTNSNGTGYIIPYDGAYGYSWMISEYELRNWIDSFPTGAKKYIAIDSCYSGLFVDKYYKLSYDKPKLKAKYMPMNGSSSDYSSEKFAKSLTGASNTYVMTSSKGAEVSFESYELENGVFVHYLCEALGSGASIGPADTNSNGSVTAEELSQYVPPRTNNYVISASEYEYSQNPQSYDNYAGDFDIKYSSAYNNGSGNPAPTPTSTPSGGISYESGGDIIITISKPDKSEYAVLVGMMDYPGTVNDLVNTGNDAIDLKNSLVNSAQWQGANVNVYSNIRATKAAIQQTIAAASNDINSDGLFVFMYSGHGANTGGVGYLIPNDGVSDSSKRISESDLKSWIEAFPGNAKKYLLLDACYSGLFIGKSIAKSGDLRAKFIQISGSNANYNSEKLIKTLVALSNTYVMASSTGAEVSFESNYLQNGVFIYYVCEGLGSGGTIGPADTNSSGSITAEEISVYAPSRVNNYVADSTNYSYTQNPQTYDNYPGDLRVK